MSEPSPLLTPVAWVAKRDGRLVPFDADKISRALFAASESIGRPDAFLARELTDGILHFLAADAEGVPTTEQIGDTVIKVVRELGQPALSRAFADGQRRIRETGKTASTPQASVRPERPAGPSVEQLSGWIDAGTEPGELARLTAGPALQAYSLDNVFARDLASAHNEGLLTLGGLETPLQLEAGVLGPEVVESRTWPPSFSELIPTIGQARTVVGGSIAIEGLEQSAARTPGPALSATAVEGLVSTLHVTGSRVVVNLNIAAPPAWAVDLAEGPLFADPAQLPFRQDLAATADRLLELLLRARFSSGSLRLDWHLGPRDFVPEQAARLRRLVRLAAEGAPLCFVFDRPRRPVALAEGLTRTHPAVLLKVALHLPRLWQQITERAPWRPESGSLDLFLKKLGSLARLALSAAVQKRAFLRRHRSAGLNRGFLIDRARLVVLPRGLAAPAAPGEVAALAGRIYRHLQESLERDGAAFGLSTCVEWPDLSAPVGEFQDLPGVGSTVVLAPAGDGVDAEELERRLRATWQQSEAQRLCLLPDHRPHVRDLPFS